MNDHGPGSSSYGVAGDVSVECCAALDSMPGFLHRKHAPPSHLSMSKLEMVGRAPTHPKLSSDWSHTGASRFGLKLRVVRTMMCAK